MKNLFLTSLILMTSLSAVAADKIAVTINGKSYVCSGSERAPQPAEPPAQIIRIYCECSPPPLVSLRRIGIMSDGNTKTISSQALYPSNGSFNPDELVKTCDEMARHCR